MNKVSAYHPKVDKTGQEVDPSLIKTTKPDPTQLFSFVGIPNLNLGNVSATSLAELKEAIANFEAGVVWRVCEIICF